MPSRIPFASSCRNTRTVITAVDPSAANQVVPGPSSPDGHRILLIFENCGSSVDGDAVMSAPSSGMGTKEEENGVAPDENGTFGLFVPLIVVLLPNAVTKDPAKNRLDADEFVVIERTSALAPESPPNGGGDHVFEVVSHIATALPGDEKEPPTQIFSFSLSQNIALTSPFGPPLPSALNEPEEGEYDATLFAEVPFIEEKEPAMNRVPSSAQAVLIFPPASDEPRRVSEPSEALDKRDEVVGSKERELLENKSRPANEPAMPTLPIRSKSTFGRAADARSGEPRRRKNAK